MMPKRKALRALAECGALRSWGGFLLTSDYTPEVNTIQALIQKCLQAVSDNSPCITKGNCCVIRNRVRFLGV